VTTFTRIPFRAWSIASDLVAAVRPPSVIDADADGRLASACSTSAVVIDTTDRRSRWRLFAGSYRSPSSRNRLSSSSIARSIDHHGLPDGPYVVPLTKLEPTGRRRLTDEGKELVDAAGNEGEQ
jgi:hypothetical protein